MWQVSGCGEVGGRRQQEGPPARSARQNACTRTKEQEVRTFT